MSRSTRSIRARSRAAWPRSSEHGDACGHSRRRRRGAEPRADHRLDHAGDDHAGARHDDRQCRAALYAGQPVDGAGPDHLGADLLYRRGGDHDAGDRLDHRPLRAEARLPDLGRRLHRRFDAVRRRQQPRRDGAVPPAAGRVRRGAGAAVAIGAARHQSAREAGSGDGDLGRRHHGRPHSRARRSAAGSPSTTIGAGSSTSTCRSASWPFSASSSSSATPGATAGCASISSASPC